MRPKHRPPGARRRARLTPRQRKPPIGGKPWTSRKPYVVASLTDPSQVFPPEGATANAPDAVPDNVQQAVTTIEINEECLVAEICIDRYLWALYERAPKVDAIKVHEQRKVTIKRKGKTKTVTRTFTRRVDEDFTWKDPKAADRAGMSMMDYVIGGMDRKLQAQAVSHPSRR